MLVFYVLLLFPILIQHIAIGKDSINYREKNRNALFFFFVVVTVLVSLRHESVGNDTRNYIYYFEMFSKMSWLEVGKDYAEVGFSYYNKIISLFTKEYQVYFAITAVITIAMIYPTYRRLSIDAMLTIVLFCTMSTFVMFFSGIRQMLAIGIGFIAYEFARKKNLLGFIVAVLVAVSFHTSAFMLVFMYPLYYAKITRKWLIAIIPAILLIFMFNRQIFSVLAFFQETYTEYDASITQTNAYSMIILFTVFAIFSYVIPEESLLDDEIVGLRNFLLLSLVLQMFAPLHTVAMRMNYYYIIFIPLLIPKIIENRSKRWEQVALLSRNVMIVFFLLYFFVNASSGGGLHVFPYHFFWENVK